VWEILKTSGIDPSGVAGWADLVSVPALSARRDPGERLFAVGLLDGTQAYVLAVIEHASRRIRILKVTQHPTGEWTSAAGPQPSHGLRRTGAPGQVHDPRLRLGLHRRVRHGAGRRRYPDRAPQRSDASHERHRRRLDRGCCRELLDRTLVWDQAHLRRILHAYEIHHNQHRPHRSLDAATPLRPLPEPVDLDRYRARRQTRTAAARLAGHGFVSAPGWR
jgi:putative transposase